MQISQRRAIERGKPFIRNRVETDQRMALAITQLHVKAEGLDQLIPLQRGEEGGEARQAWSRSPNRPAIRSR
jgi:hypothetical protein